MTLVLMAVGLLVTAAGLLTIGFGIPINAFSLGNTLIISGTVASVGGLILIGNEGWYPRGGVRAHTDEQPIDAAAFVLAHRGAYEATRDRHHLQRMQEAFGWFLGDNRLGVPLHDPQTGGCRDGLGQTAANENQGAESTICYLLSLLEMATVADEPAGPGPEALPDTN